ncbi:UDP-4-amino-4,6-dideoxy-N-acetyl-beta-L-altrosamine N-acetyltransferase [Halalkalibacter flavus]|uniref:UDP-4-amino-4, 6-dideoxy-N-acetyl-beta-L-altrosamine N-acetyltransferase n=1 Tax=Halalkalibacter flavus TaxID=3090668 RepID=UPI002FCAB845
MKRYQFHLRKITAQDLEKILIWRNSPRIRYYMYNDHIIPMEEHNKWFEKIKNSKESIYLMFELNGKPMGLVNFNKINQETQTASWGFYVGEDKAPKGTGITLGVLGLEYAFEKLNLKKLRGEAFAFNSASINFHKKLGFVVEDRLEKHVLKNERYEDIIVFTMYRDKWITNKENLKEYCLSEEK